MEAWSEHGQGKKCNRSSALETSWRGLPTSNSGITKAEMTMTSMNVTLVVSLVTRVLLEIS